MTERDGGRRAGLINAIMMALVLSAFGWWLDIVLPPWAVAVSATVYILMDWAGVSSARLVEGETSPRKFPMTPYLRTLLLIATSALLWLAFIFGPTLVHAQERPGWRQYCNNWGHCVWRRVYRPPVYSYERRSTDWDESGWRERGGRIDLCLPEEVDVLSTEHQSEENAREAARKLWMAKVQWAKGGQYMDLDEAAHIRWRCGPSNAHDTASGRLSEATGVLTGKGGQNVRCALWARPCRVERTQGDSKGSRR